MDHLTTMDTESANIDAIDAPEGNYRLISNDVRNLSFETFYKHLGFMNSADINPVTNKTEFDTFLHTLHQTLPACFRYSNGIR